MYRYDFERKKPVVVDPLNCMVGCTTCANTCPTNAIEFPPLSSVLGLFIAGGTGLAPALALIEQQVNLFPERDMVLLWGMRSEADFYALDVLQSLTSRAPGLSVVLATELPQEAMPPMERLIFTKGNVVEVIRQRDLLAQHRDIYAAGPTPMLRELVRFLDQQGVDKGAVHVDSFAV